MILDKFPTTEEFYKIYWNRKAFVVRGAIDSVEFDNFIDGDTLAGLSLEEDIKSRLIITEGDNKWSCEHGPLDEDRFTTLGEENWSLLVQNVDQYHPDTAQLLEHFNFSPRWLLDDIMVSYSAAGGSVGPHTDSYHVFLVQGMGRRKWTIGETPIQNEDLIEGLDLKVLKDGVQGQKIEVTIGDVIYLPPNFAHEGITLDHAMTFSVGFLGPKMSELFVEYGYYLEENDQSNKRYKGEGLTPKGAGAEMSQDAKKTLKNDMQDAINAQSFSDWLENYFINGHEDED